MEVWRNSYEGLDLVIVNPSIILGPGDWKSGSSRFFYTIKKGLKFFTKGVNGFVDVRDVSSAMILLLEDENWEKVRNKRYILNAENLPYEMLFRMMAGSMGVKPPKYHAGPFLLYVAGIVTSILSFVPVLRNSFPRGTLKNAGKMSLYDGSKICHETSFVYTPISVTIQNYSEIYLKDTGHII